MGGGLLPRRLRLTARENSTAGESATIRPSPRDSSTGGGSPRHPRPGAHEAIGLQKTGPSPRARAPNSSPISNGSHVSSTREQRLRPPGVGAQRLHIPEWGVTGRGAGPASSLSSGADPWPKATLPSHASGRPERCKHVDPLLRATAWLACGFSNTARVAEEKNGGSEKIKKHEVEEAGFKPGSDHLPAGRKSGLEAPSRSLPNPTRSERTSTGGTGTTGNPVCHGGRGGGGLGGRRSRGTPKLAYTAFPKQYGDQTSTAVATNT